MKKTTWVVVKGETEVIRVSTKKLAKIIAVEINGQVQKYTVE